MGNNCPCITKFVNNNDYNLSHDKNNITNNQQEEKEITNDTNIKNIYVSAKEESKFNEEPSKNYKGNFNNNISNNENQETSRLNNINISINNYNKIINNYDNSSNKKKEVQIYPIKNEISKEKNILYINKINKYVKGFLFRKRYNKTLKAQLIKKGNDLYNEYIKLTKNKKVTEILESKEPNIIAYLQCSWTEFYSKDPTNEIKSEISSIKKYPKKIILFKYKTFSYNPDNITECINSAKSCYVGEGDLYQGQRLGMGKTIYSNGSIEEGTYLKNDFVGWNKFIDNQGIIYVGLFNKNGLNGKGLRYNKEINHIYKGDFLNGLRHGTGKDYRDNIKYEGEFRKDKKCGKGKILFESGDTYEGEFSDNKFNGYGHYIWAKNKHEYKGNYLNGKFNGEGFYKWGENEYYNGEYVNGIKEGEGELCFKGGKKFFVNFTNGKPNGIGIFQDEDGNRCEVEFINGKINKKYKRS